MIIELFRAVIFYRDLLGEIQSHIRGKKYKDLTDGDFSDYFFIR